MPTYQYACTACDHRFDAVQSFSDASLTECPTCTGGLRKVFSSVGIVFKGSGFYRTDSRNGSTVGAKSDNGSDSGGSAGESSSEKPSGEKPTSSAGASGKDSGSSSSGSSSGSGGGSGAKAASTSS